MFDENNKGVGKLRLLLTSSELLLGLSSVSISTSDIGLLIRCLKATPT